MAGNQREMQRREKREVKDRRNRIIIWSVIAVIVAVLVVMKIFEINVNSVKDRFTDENGKLSLTQGVSVNNLPYNIDASQNVKMTNFNNRLGILTPNKFIVFNTKSAEAGYVFEHGYSNPVSASSGIYTLVYDQGGSSYRVDTVSEQVYEEELDNTIFCADVSKNGTAAIATASEEKLCDIKVFSAALEKKLDISLSYGYIIDIALSDNSKQIAAAVVSSENAQLKTTVYFYNLDGSEAGSVQLPSGTLADIRYDGKTLWAVGDSYLGIIKNFKYEDVYKQGTINMKCFNYNLSGDIITAYGDYTNSTEYTVACVKSSGKIKNEFNITGNVKSISANDTLVSVLMSDETVSYSINSGEVKERAPASDAVKSICRIGSAVYIHKQSVIDVAVKSEDGND